MSCKGCGLLDAILCFECADIGLVADKMQALASEVFALQAAKRDLMLALKVEHAHHLTHPEVVKWDCPTCAVVTKYFTETDASRR